MPLFWTRVDLGVMAIKECYAFPKAIALLEPHHQTVQCYIKDSFLERSYPSAEVQSVYSIKYYYSFSSTRKALSLNDPVRLILFYCLMAYQPS